MDLSNNKILNNKISRCEMCNKKLTLLSFTCKCKKKFCLDHQLPELHQCLFNFKRYLDRNNKKYSIKSQ